LINADLSSYTGTLWGDPSGLSYRDFGPLEEAWNHLDYYDQTTKLIHYTSVPNQPWKKPGNAYASLFLRELRQALAEGAIERSLVEKEIAEGHVYPEILTDMAKA